MVRSTFTGLESVTHPVLTALDVQQLAMMHVDMSNLYKRTRVPGLLV